MTKKQIKLNQATEEAEEEKSALQDRDYLPDLTGEQD